MNITRNMAQNRKVDKMGEKTYRVLGVTGAGSIAIGTVILVIGIVTGILSIVTGAVLLKQKSKIIF